MTEEERQKAQAIREATRGMSGLDRVKAMGSLAMRGELDDATKAGFLGSNYDDAVERKKRAEEWKSGGGGCFITTAVCAADGKPDDCYELTTFRAFRDGWLVKQPDGQSLIDKYYDIAPKIVDKINRLPDASTVYQSIRAEYLEPCLSFIEQGKNLECKRLYVRMVESLQQSFLK